MMASGVLFDIDFFEPHIVVYLLEDDGHFWRLTTPFAHTVYLWGSRRELPAICRLAETSRVVALSGWVTRLEFYSNRPRRVMAARVVRQAGLKELYRRLTRSCLSAEMYDSTLDPAQAWLMARGLHPLARVVWQASRGRLIHIQPLDTPWDPPFAVPPLKTLHLRLEQPTSTPMVQNALRIEMDGRRDSLPLRRPEEVIRGLNDWIQRADPDVIWSREGDGAIFPWLVEQAAGLGLPLTLDREPQALHRRVERTGKSFMVYGQVVYKAPSYPLMGRWHLDEQNSFFLRESGLEGLLEMARISAIPVQRMARSSAGTALTNMEIRNALLAGFLIPSRKTQLETPKTALDLLRVDKGGLTYFPPAGMHEQVAELDYAQMYPTIMLIHNISPEVINCPCCPGLQPVPATGYHTCTRRAGLIPQTIRPVLKQRASYKQLKRKAATPAERRAYEQRYSALKWMLVTTFGYQGYKNARFGVIEAHEAVTAWGRESLLRAKEYAEDAGFSLLHALTDSLYLVKNPPFSDESLTGLTERVNRATGLDLALEGVFDWICFPTSKITPNLSAATRFFGRFASGEVKVRGIFLRRKDIPHVIRTAQKEMLEAMARCKTIAELTARHNEVLEVFRHHRNRLQSGGVTREELFFKLRVSRHLADYKSNSPASVCLRLLARRGIQPQPGQSVRYVIVDRRASDPLHRYLPEPLASERPCYEVSAYLELLQAAYDELAGELPCHWPDMAKRTHQLRLF
ncbi:MAG: hypothetical protein OEW12_02030 [Deltaproteobacteria bacterium]|nr:hypothetical protein [Deltaproteobacteria bacterium]